MNRFNLFFVFLFTLISSALHYSVREEESIKQEIKSLMYLQPALQGNQGNIVEVDAKTSVILNSVESAKEKNVCE